MAADDPTRVQVTDYSLRYGKSNCTWASCKEVTSIVTVTVPDLLTVQGCTAEIFKCHQIRVTYAPKLLFTESRDVADFAESDWAHLTRYSAACVVTGELSTNIREVSQCPAK